MASVSVVGQHPAPHRLDSEPPLLLLKLSSAKKKISLPRRSSREKLMLRRSSGSSAEPSSAEWDSANRHLDPAAVPGESRVAHSPELHGKTGCADCDRRSRGAGGGSAGSSGGGGGSSDCNSNSDTVRDLNRDTGGRKSWTASDVTLSGGAAYRATGRRSTWSSDRRHQGVSSPPSMPVRGASGGGDVPLERVTQGRTGVVRLVRAEPPRREAWSIFPPRGLATVDPRMKAERGEGHRFEAKPVTQDWCDACSRQISAQGLKCQSKSCYFFYFFLVLSNYLLIELIRNCQNCDCDVVREPTPSFPGENDTSSQLSFHKHKAPCKSHYLGLAHLLSQGL